MILNKKLEKPFNKVPPEGNQLETLQPSEIKAKLSGKVTSLLKKRDRSIESRISFASNEPNLNNAGHQSKQFELKQHKKKASTTTDSLNIKDDYRCTMVNNENGNQINIEFEQYLKPAQ